MIASVPSVPSRRRWLPAGGVRLRLTALYSSLFLCCGAGLLAITYVLVDHATAIHAVATRTPGGRPAPGAAVSTQLVDMHQLLEQSGTALAIMTAVSVMLGWAVAGQVLRPLRAMTEATRRISEESLDQRLALPGPRDELSELGDTIDGLLDRLEVAFAAQRRFAANASHELRTPLATMRASLEVAMAKPAAVPEHIRTLEQRLRQEFDRTERLLDGLLALARSQHTPPGKDLSVALDKLASKAVALHAEEIAAKHLKVDVEASGRAHVPGSEILLARMVENVIENAITHNEPGGWIRIKPTSAGSSVSFMIENGGKLLDQHEVDQLAEPFTRLAAPRTGSETSTGLGLSIVASIAHAHGGTLDLHARPDGGLRVMIKLPGGKPIELEAQA